MNRPVYSHSLMLLIFKQYSPIIYSSIPVINMDDINSSIGCFLSGFRKYINTAPAPYIGKYGPYNTPRFISW